MVFDIFSCVALFLSALNTLFLGIVAFASVKRINAEKKRLESIKKSFFGGDSFEVDVD